MPAEKTDRDCPSKLRVWYPDFTLKDPNLLGRYVERDGDQHLTYRCVKQPTGHDGDHGWLQGGDADYTYRWS